MNKKKKNKLLEGKSKWVILGTILFFVFGIAALVLGFGLANGWDSVLAWFTSRWAIYIYILIAFLIFLIVWVYFKNKIGED